MNNVQTVWLVMYSDWNDKWCEAVFSSELAAEEYREGEKSQYPRACYYIEEMELQH